MRGRPTGWADPRGEEIDRACPHRAAGPPLAPELFRGQAKGLTLPKGFADLDWAGLELLGWRDPKAPLRGYLVVERLVDEATRPVGIAVRAAESRMSARTAAMCLLCRTTRSGDAVSLFTARRTGAAGRNGNTVGTYMCTDLGCAERVRTEIPPWLQDRNPAEVVAERVAELRERVRGFVDAVRRSCVQSIGGGASDGA